MAWANILEYIFLEHTGTFDFMILETEKQYMKLYWIVLDLFPMF